MSRFGLTTHQHEVVSRAMAQEDARRVHVVISVSGAHAYGFPSTDSDVDLKAVHVTPAAQLLSMNPTSTHVDRMETIRGVEVDYTSNELVGVLGGILAGNGNYVERVLGGVSWSTHPLLEELQPLARQALSRRIHRHYRGFATGQLRALQDAPVKSVKKVLYVLRTALTGTHVLLTGEVQPNVALLLERYRFSDAAALIQRKTAGERTAMTDAEVQQWTTRLGDALQVLDDSVARSVLPEETPEPRALEAWLLQVRRRFWE
jgi:predicted nucleotidyltransferase